MKLESFVAEVVVLGGLMSLTEETCWMKEMMRVKGVGRVEVRIGCDNMRGNVDRRPELEMAVGRRWTRSVEEPNPPELRPLKRSKCCSDHCHCRGHRSRFWLMKFLAAKMEIGHEPSPSRC